MERFPENELSETGISLKGLVRRIREWRESRRLNAPVFRPIDDHGNAVLSVYSGPSGPIATLARISHNVHSGRPAGEGLPPDPLNDPNSP